MRHVALLTLLAFTCFVPPAEKASPQLLSLRRDILAVTRDPTASRQQQLWKASRLVQDACLGADWQLVRNELAKQKLIPIRSRESQYLSHRSYVVQKGVFSAGNRAHDMLLEFEIDKRDTADVPGAKAGRIITARAGFRARINEDFDVFVSRKAYPPDSALQVVLTDPEVRRTAETFPVLKEVSVSYDLIRDRWQEWNPSGFYIDLNFEIDAKKEIAGAHLFYTVESGLDPFKDWKGNSREGPFVPKDTLGGIRGWGSSEWWKGDKETVERNKKKYLNRPKE
jgi:hypothetical protein